MKTPLNIANLKIFMVVSKKPSLLCSTTKYENETNTENTLEKP
jgi:hypothetical protein